MKLAILLSTAFLSSCSPQTPAEQTIGVQSIDFDSPTAEAIDILNNAVGCDWLVPGDTVTIHNDPSAPCGDTWNEDLRPEHSAGAFDCQDGTFEIILTAPGDVRTQLCIIMHELGHVGGLADNASGRMMSQDWCPESFIWPSDAESAALRQRFCR